nr:cAMP-dependent protein kinase catalytic subunit PRKX-like [Ciona intestinalis]|eukprot:XP_002126100.1 cAMP-dependent protein kinase catalytic subunit PRKX-like [Ciona intestinalis]
MSDSKTVSNSTNSNNVASVCDTTVDNLASSVSTVKLGNTNTSSTEHKLNSSPSTPKGENVQNSNPAAGDTAATLNSVGNLNLPHVTQRGLEQGATGGGSRSPEYSVGRVERKLSLNDLEILSTIGTGTFGRVVLVKEKHTKEHFALKVMKICDIIKLKQVQHVKNEKSILNQIQHPFIVQLFWADHDNSFLYMLLEFACGGELFSYLRNAGRFNNSTSLFFASEIVSALEYLHQRHIVYRDLKPENVLLDRDGHTKLTDFGFAKKVEDRTWTLCGTPEYLAPEVIQSKGHGRSVDWWALGILTYEMLAGFPPFWDESPFGIYQKILRGKVEFPKNMEGYAKDLIKKLLTADRTRRLGNMKNASEDVKNHKWFRNIDWDAVVEKKMIPPIIPKVKHSGDTRNFEDYPEDNWQTTAAAQPKELSAFTDF